MKILNNVKTINSDWKLIIIWEDTCPLWCYSVEDAEILNWDGFENALGWKETTTNTKLEELRAAVEAAYDTYEEAREAYRLELR
tara:strand:+ start:160 stop:411 length:252 start_codon:yes stop_codon:yes gene_type:complete